MQENIEDKRERKIDFSIDYTDCFAYGRYGCNALEKMECRKNGKCAFYTPRHVYLQKLKASRERIERLYGNR